MSRDDFETKRRNTAAIAIANDFTISYNNLREREEEAAKKRLSDEAFIIHKKAEEAAAQAARNSVPIGSTYQAQIVDQAKKEGQSSSQISKAELQYLEQLSRQIYAQVFNQPLPSFRRAPQRRRNNPQQHANGQAGTATTTANSQTTTTQVQTNPTVTTVSSGTADQHIPNVVSTDTKDTGHANSSSGSDYNNFEDSSYDYEADSNNYPAEFKYTRQEEDHITRVKDQLRFDDCWYETREVLDEHQNNEYVFTVLNQRLDLFLYKMSQDDKFMSLVKADPLTASLDHQFAFHLGFRAYAKDLAHAHPEAHKGFSTLSDNPYILMPSAGHRQQDGDQKPYDAPSRGLGMSFVEE